MSEPELDFRSQELIDTIKYFRALRTKTTRKVNPFAEADEPVQKDPPTETNIRAQILIKYMEDLMDAYQESQSQFLRLLLDIEKIGLRDTKTFRDVLLRRTNRELNKFE